MGSNIVPWSSRKKRVVLARQDPSSGAIQRNVSRLFNEFLTSSIVPELISEPLSSLGDRLSGFSPAVNVRKSMTHLLVSVEVPGMDERDIEISLTTEGLIIRGERRSAVPLAEVEQEEYVESLYGAFERIVPLSGLSVDEDHVEATSSKGVVTISVPLRASSSSGVRKVSIRAE
jgi:HSP20 family protein